MYDTDRITLEQVLPFGPFRSAKTNFIKNLKGARVILEETANDELEVADGFLAALATG